MTAQYASFRYRAIDADGIPIGGAQLFVYEAGTTTKLIVYATDALTTQLSNPVDADAGGLFPQIFLAVDDYKFVLALSTDSDPPTSPVWTNDDYEVAANPSITVGAGLQTVSGTTRVYSPVNAQSGTTYTMQSSDRAKLVSFTNSNAVAVTQPAADSTNFPDGWFTDIENRGLGIVTITSASNIDAIASITLNRGQGIRLFSDGATYYTQRGKPQELYTQTGGTLTIATGAITPGAFPQYLVDTEAAAVIDDLATINGEIDGKLLFLRTVADARDVIVKHNTGNIYNPALQDIVLGKTQDVIELRYDAALAKWIVIAAPTVATAKYTYSVSSGTNGGSSTANAWTTRPINTEEFDDIGITLSANQITIPAGTYLMQASGKFIADTAYAARVRLQNITATSTIAVSDTDYAGNTAIMLTPYLMPAKVTFAVSTVVELQYYTTLAKATTGLGNPASIASTNEIYAQLFIEKIA